jgi:hypothetical protein
MVIAPARAQQYFVVPERSSSDSDAGQLSCGLPLLCHFERYSSRGAGQLSATTSLTFVLALYNALAA